MNEEEPTPETEAGDTPRIYVASLSDYNDGRLHGRWIEAAQDTETLAEEVQAMLEASPAGLAEEYAVHDFEGFGDWHVGEFESLDSISRVALAIEAHGLAFAAWIAYTGSTDIEQIDRYEEAFMGEFASPTEFAELYAEDIGLQITIEPDGLAQYVRFDAEAFGRDIEIELHVVEKPGGGIWLFDPHV